MRSVDWLILQPHIYINPPHIAKYGFVVDGFFSPDRGIRMESSTSFASFDDTPFSWLLNTEESTVEVFVNYDLSPNLDIPSDLNMMTKIISDLKNMPPQVKELSKQLLAVENDDLYSFLLSTVNDLTYNINQYFQALTQKDLKQIAISLADLRVQCKRILNSLWNVNDKLSTNPSKNNLQNDVLNVTARIEHLSNKVLVEVQNLFVYETTSGSGFRINSRICLSNNFCFPSLEVNVLNSFNNCPNLKDQHQINQPVPNVCMTGEYFITQTLNQFIRVPAGSKLRLAFACNVNHWIGNIPVYIKLLGIEQDTTMHLTMDDIYFSFSGKLWGLFDVSGNVTSRLGSFESMVLSANGEVAVEGPLSLGKILKNNIISLSHKLVDDSERRLSQVSKSLDIAISTLQNTLKEEAIQTANVAEARDKHDSALKDIVEANNAVERARKTLEDLRHDTRDLEEAVDNVCEIHECSGVCLPGSKLVPYVEDVYGYVPYECCINKEESTVVNETTACCDICYLATPVKTMSLDPIKLITAAYDFIMKKYISGVIAVITSIKKGSRNSYSKGECCEECQKPVLVTATLQSCSTCVNYEIIGQIKRSKTEEVFCSTHIPDANCVQTNEQCRKQRSRAFDQIKKETPDLAVPIKECDDAVLSASVAEAVLNEALIDLDNALNQQKEVSDRVMILKKHFNNTQDALDKIRREVEAGLNIKQHQINGSLEDSLELKKLHFNIDLVEEDTSMIPVVCYMTLSSTPVQIQVFIDANNLNYTIENAALFITGELFGDVTRSVGRRRGVNQNRDGFRRRRDITTFIQQPPIQKIGYILVNDSQDLNITSSLSRDQNVIRNEERCADYNNILDFVKHSFQTLLETVNISKVANAKSLETEEMFQHDYLYNLSVVTSPSDVNRSALLYFNLTMSDLEESNTGNGVEEKALSKVINSLKRKTNNTKSLLEVDLMTNWKTVMDQYTRNASGITDCEGFYDCLTAELIALKYLSEGKEIYQNVSALDEYVSTFLNANLSSSDKLETSGKIVLTRVIFLKNYNDICLEAPVITEHPKPNISTVEGEDITLTCQATGNPLPKFSWKFNGQILSGMNSNSLHLNQVNSSNSGTYSCQACNKVTKVSSLQCDVTIEFAPLITEHPQDTVIEHGNIEGAYFTCQASARPLADYQWYFQSLSSDMELIPGQNGSIIEILSPTFNQDGWYTCKASNNHGQQLSSAAKLHVLGISMPEFSSKIAISFFSVGSFKSKKTSLEDTIANVMSNTDAELERLNYQEFTQNGKSFLRQTTFEIKSTNATSIDVVTVSREESAYRVKDKIESIHEKVVQLKNMLTPGETFKHRGEIVEMVEFNAALNGPICPNTQYAHTDGYICVNCPPGSYRGNDNLPAVCQKCPQGFHQPKEGQTKCLRCDGCSDADFEAHKHNKLPPASSSMLSRTMISEEKHVAKKDGSKWTNSAVGVMVILIVVRIGRVIKSKVYKKQNDYQYQKMQKSGDEYVPTKKHTLCPKGKSVKALILCLLIVIYFYLFNLF
ncbi:uncharacterized protein [Antedon mediterranea]|uniref:uncharacterized protein n=1 Tax=Antedon mediterranea TaxID=105859 RepID=UPI003AF59EF5